MSGMCQDLSLNHGSILQSSGALQIVLKVAKPLMRQTLMSPFQALQTENKDCGATCSEPANGWLLPPLPQHNTDALEADAGWQIVLLEPLHRDVDATGSGCKV